MLTLIAYVLLAVVGVVFANLNATPVAFNYYIAVKELPLSWLLLFAAAFGWFIGILHGGLVRLKLWFSNLMMRRKIEKLENKLCTIKADFVQQDEL